MIFLILIISYILIFKWNFEIILIYGTEEGPHMWPKRLPYFLRFFISAIDNFSCENKKNLTQCKNNKMNKNSVNFESI